MPFIPPPNPAFVRVASIETRIANPQEYASIIEAYRTSVSPGDTITNGQSFGNKTLEFRILNANSASESVINSRTIVYWQVRGTSHSAIQTIYNRLVSSGKYAPFTPPARDGLHDNANMPTERGILLETTSGTPSLVGLVINPPYPRFTDPHDLGSEFWKILIFSLLGGGGALMGRSFLKRFSLWPFRKRATD